MSITVKNITKYYADNKALDSISFSVKKGEIVGFLGPNGAGKSTLMKIITGILKDYQGQVLINENSIDESPTVSKQKIGYLPEHNPLYPDMYIKEYLKFIADIHDISKEDITKAIEDVGLTSQQSKRIKELSKGYRQRVGLAAALLHDPDVLILDEPTTGLDPNQLVDIRDLIKKYGENKSVLFSTHIMQEVEAVCDRVIIINRGKIVANQSLRELQNPTEQTIEVEFDKSIEPQALEDLKGLKHCQNQYDNIWELHFDSKEDRRADIFDFAQKKALRILSMNRKNKGLETLFRELTQN